MDNTERALSEKETQSAYKEYLLIGCYAFFDCCANTAITEGTDALSAGLTLPPEHAAAFTLIRAGHMTHTSTEEATRMGSVLNWASSASPVADKRARTRIAYSPNSCTSISAAPVLPRARAHWIRYATRSPTARKLTRAKCRYSSDREWREQQAQVTARELRSHKKRKAMAKAIDIEKAHHDCRPVWDYKLRNLRYPGRSHNNTQMRCNSPRRDPIFHGDHKA
jgi:hypothetical protein